MFKVKGSKAWRCVVDQGIHQLLIRRFELRIGRVKILHSAYQSKSLKLRKRPKKRPEYCVVNAKISHTIYNQVLEHFGSSVQDEIIEDTRS